MNPSVTQSSSASSLTPVGRGLIPVEAIVQFLTGRRRNRVVLFQLWLCDSCMSTRIVRGHELFFMAETPFNSFVQCPEGRGEKKEIHWKRKQHDEDAKPEFCFLHGSIISRVTLL